MASALASRLSRLAIGTKSNPAHRTITSLVLRTNNEINNNILRRFSVPGRSSAIVAYDFPNVDEKAGVRSLSSVAQQQVIPGSIANDFGATSSLSTLMAQKDAENFAAFTYANRHQKGEGLFICGQWFIDVSVASGISDNCCEILSCSNNML